MRRHTGIVLGSCLIFICPLSQAAGKLKPGLWEMTMQSDTMKNLPEMSPEQLQQMKQMGIEMPMMRNDAMTHHICISKEMAESEQVPIGQQEQAGCSARNIQHSANGWSMDVLCDSPEMKGKGKVTGSYSSPLSIQSIYDFKGVSHGQAINQHMESKGKWLSAECGKVKPVSEFTKSK